MTLDFRRMRPMMFKKRFLDDDISVSARILHHIGLAALSAGIILSVW
jgi:hypothetical protein